MGIKNHVMHKRLTKVISDVHHEVDVLMVRHWSKQKIRATWPHGYPEELLQRGRWRSDTRWPIGWGI